MKKLLSILMSVLLLCAMLPLGAVGVSAEETYNGLIYTVFAGKAAIIGSTDELPADLVIPDTIEGYPVTEIRYDAFYQCDITSVYIPSSVVSIVDGLFKSCSELLSINVDPENPKYASLNDVLFDKEMTTLLAYPRGKDDDVYMIPEGVAVIADSAFLSNNFLREVWLPDSVISIERYAFGYCYYLKEITIPANVETISSDAFNFCRNFKAINVDDNNSHYRSVDGVLFDEGMTSLVRYPEEKENNTYIIPEGVTTIEESAFASCDLQSVIIPEGVKTIGYWAFYECNDLATITIPKSVTFIDWNVFSSCRKLTNVYYRGTEVDREGLDIGDNNAPFLNATWHYADDPISDVVTHSVMDTANGNGLAFRFELMADGVGVKNRCEADLTNATVNYLGTACKLVKMGAVLTNDAEVASDLTLAKVNGGTVLDVPAVYLQELNEDSCAFAVRIINIPDTQLERTIYVRPYYVVEVDGEEIVVYSDVDAASCAEYI